MTTNFLTMADSKYFETVILSAKQISKLHPESQFFIYDWGFNPEQRAELNDILNVQILEWQLRFIPIKISLGKILTIKKLLGISRWVDIVHNIFFNREKLVDSKNFLQIPISEMRYFNKFLCIEDFINNHSDKFIFIDADAFLINPLDEVCQADFDIGLTLRRKNEITYETNKCRVLNVGVMMFLGNKHKHKSFVKEWKNELLNTQELYCEQTSLTRMLYKKEKSVYENVNITHDIIFENNKMKIKILPCEIYNYNWIEEFDTKKDRDRVKILHFKSGRFNTPIFKKIAKELNL